MLGSINCSFLNYETYLFVNGDYGCRDDGTSIERVKDAEGKTIKFRSPAAVLMHFMASGWEWVGNGDTLYSGGDSTRSYWIIRKRCTKEEMLAAAKAGRKR